MSNFKTRVHREQLPFNCKTSLPRPRELFTMFKLNLCIALFLLSPCILLVCGENINILMIRDQLNLVNIHIPGYEALTGHKVNLIDLTSYSDLRDQILADLRKGSPFYDAFIFNGQMKSELILCSDCDPEQRPLIAPLTELIRNDPALQWNDVAVFQRTTNSAYDGDIYTVPIDGDFHYMYYRQDILDKFGLGIPQTWDDFIAVASQLNGKDLNGDGVADFGACVERKSVPGWNPAPYFFWTLASSYLQSNGTSQGMFFDAKTMDIMINTTGFLEAAQKFKELAQYGPEEDGTFLRAAFVSGRCALSIDWGDIAARSQDNVSTVANVTGMSLAPGTRRVFNRDTRQMEQCTSTLCPLMDANGVNRAPFAATLGWTTAVSRFIPDSRRQAAYGFLSYVSQPAQSIQSVLLALGWDLVRESQMNPQLFLSHGFSNITAVTFVDASKSAQNHLNAVVDLPLEQWSAYYESFGSRLTQYLHDQLSLEDLQSQTVDEWNTLLDKYGRRDQHTSYALSIGAHRPVFDEEVTLPDALRIAFLAISGACILIALGLVIYVVVHRHKKIIRGTSPTFHYTTLGGAVLIFLSVLLFSIPTVTSELCTSSMWLFALGFGFIYGSIFVKLYRLWRLSTKSLVIKKITDAHLMPFLGGILVVYIAVLIAWTVVDPPTAAQYRQSLGPDQFMMVCQTGSTGIILFGIILGWSCCLLLLGIILSFLTRNLAEAYNESKPVSMSVYIYSFSAVILIPILFTVPNALVVFIVTDAVLVFSTLVTLIALYLTKIVRIQKGLGDKVSIGRSGSTAGSTPPNASVLEKMPTSARQDPIRKLELENDLLRERIRDLENQLRARPTF